MLGLGCCKAAFPGIWVLFGNFLAGWDFSGLGVL